MHKNLMRFQSLLLAIVVTALLVHTGAVTAADDRAALSGLSEGKIAFDLKDGEGRALLARLDIIDETRLSLIQQGVTPHFILAFRGPATRVVQTTRTRSSRKTASSPPSRGEVKELSAAPAWTASSNARSPFARRAPARTKAAANPCGRQRLYFADGVPAKATRTHRAVISAVRRCATLLAGIRCSGFCRVSAAGARACRSICARTIIPSADPHRRAERAGGPSDIGAR